MSASSTGAAVNRQAEERMAFADAALALAGHEITDPVVRSILEQQARGELTGEAPREAIRQYLQG